MMDILLEDISLTEDKELLEIIKRYDDNIILQQLLCIDEVIDMFKYYVKHQTEYASDLDDYDCIDPKIYDKYEDGNYYFSLGIINNDEDESDINFLLNLLKEQFGINLNKDCKVGDIFRILLMDCGEYYITDDILTIKICYDTYKVSWLKDYFEEK